MLYTNPRGSTGYGQAFVNGIEKSYPGKDFDDLMSGVDATIAKGIVDTTRMYVFGCSGWWRPHRLGGGPHEPIRGGLVQLPGDQLDVVRRPANSYGPSWYDVFEKPFWEDPSDHLLLAPDVRRQRAHADDSNT